jgi:preprotein translocase subunit YajC
MSLIPDAFAQSAAGGAAGAPNPTVAMLIQIGYFVPIILIFYLLLIRPQQQQAKKTRQMLAALKRGDNVVTSGGILGTVIGIDEQKVTLHVADKVELQFAKNAIVNVVPEGGAR